MDRRFFLITCASYLALGCNNPNEPKSALKTATSQQAPSKKPPEDAPELPPEQSPDLPPGLIPDHIRLAHAAEARTQQHVIYDPAYVALAYPMGDPPNDRGVCSDVVIRSYREVGIDLQVKVHEDMKANFSAYPNRWGLARPDRNIDHRRVPNLETYFHRLGAQLSVNTPISRLEPGDLVTWMIDGRLPHIGVVTTKKSPSGNLLIAHNIGRGPELEDCYDNWSRKNVFRHRPWDT